MNVVLKDGKMNTNVAGDYNMKIGGDMNLDVKLTSDRNGKWF